MPQQEAGKLPHDVVLWPKTGYTANGQSLVGSPEPIKANWKWRDSDKQSGAGAKATAVVDRAIESGSLMWKGKLEEWTGLTPEQAAGQSIMKVVGQDTVPDIKGRGTPYRKVTLAKYRDAWPILDGSTVQLAYRELSSIRYSKTAAHADQIDQITITAEYRDSNGKKIVGRSVEASLSDPTDILYVSPQITDQAGRVLFVLRASAPASIAVSLLTTVDNDLFGSKAIEFITPV